METNAAVVWYCRSRVLGVIPDDDADAGKYAVGPDCADVAAGWLLTSR